MHFVLAFWTNFFCFRSLLFIYSLLLHLIKCALIIQWIVTLEFCRVLCSLVDVYLYVWQIVFDSLVTILQYQQISFVRSKSISSECSAQIIFQINKQIFTTRWRWMHFVFSSEAMTLLKLNIGISIRSENSKHYKLFEYQFHHRLTQIL